MRKVFWIFMAFLAFSLLGLGMVSANVDGGFGMHVFTY